jgi:FkbM family methyltransferase
MLESRDMDPGLIYDVGAHNGWDTEHYLNLGFRVVAIDANPEAISDLGLKFKDRIDAKQLTLLNCAIGDQGQNTFWISDHSDWSSFDEGVAKRSNTNARPIEVECVPFSRILKQYGVPFYLKIDIEGSDGFCLAALKDFNDRPQFISWEATDPDGIGQLRLMRDLGYTKFKIIRQTDFFSIGDGIVHRKLRGLLRRLLLRPRPKNFQIGSSGPFGEETPGNWHSWTDIAERWRSMREVELPIWLWYDFHAAR